MPGQYGQQQERNNVGDLDHRVYGGAGGVLVGIAYGVAGNACLVGFGALQVFDTLAVHEAVFEALLGIVPSAATGGHGDGNKQAGDDHAHEHGAEGSKAFGLAGNPGDNGEDHDG